MATIKLCQNAKLKLTDISRMSSLICNKRNIAVQREPSSLLSTNSLKQSQLGTLNQNRTLKCELTTSTLNQPHIEVRSCQKPFLNYCKLFVNQYKPEMCMNIYQVREYCDEDGNMGVGIGVQDCWKCGKKIDATSEQYFCQCGVIQPPHERTYFEVMELPNDFNLDTMALTERFRNLQSQLHPDKFTTHTQVEKEYSQLQSSLVNNAYQTLLKPLHRGLYLLKLYNQEIHEEDIHLDSLFLMEIMEINENLDSVHAIDELSQVESENNDKINELIQGISEAFSNKELFQAKKKLAELQYYCNIDEKIKEKKNVLLS